MKKILLSSLLVLGLSTALVVVSCKDKNNNNITPTYRSQAAGTGANPCLYCVTVTGTSTPQTPATQNSSLFTGGSGWTYYSCSLYPNTITSTNGSTQVQILFGGGLNIGTYAFTSGIPTAGQARMTISNAPGQPDGITWYSKSGSVTTNTITGGGYSASYSNIGCVQQTYLFPMVTVSGTISCQ